jgi:hypothetical protein
LLLLLLLLLSLLRCRCPSSFWHEPVPDLHCAELSCAAIRENRFEAF